RGTAGRKTSGPRPAAVHAALGLPVPGERAAGGGEERAGGRAAQERARLGRLRRRERPAQPGRAEPQRSARLVRRSPAPRAARRAARRALPTPRPDHARPHLFERLRGQPRILAARKTSADRAEPEMAVGGLVPAAPQRHLRAARAAREGPGHARARHHRQGLRGGRSGPRRAPGLPRSGRQRQRVRDWLGRQGPAPLVARRAGDAPHAPDLGVHRADGSVLRWPRRVPTRRHDPLMAAVRAVVFDLDGTLIDSRLDIAHAANAALVRAGRTALDPAEIATYVGDGARRLMQRAARVAADDPGLDRLLEDFLRAYEAAATPHTHRMPGAERALTALAHLPLAVCTNKPRRTTDIVLGELGLGPHFRAVVAGG